MAQAADKKSQTDGEVFEPDLKLAETPADVIIIGGGPAGIAAAIWCVDLGLKPMILEQSDKLGGQLHHIFNPITNYPGLRAANGREMLEKFLGSLDFQKTEVRFGARVSGIVPDQHLIEFSSGESIKAKAMIIATGVRRRRLGIPGEEQFYGKGIMASGVRDRGMVRERRVAIIGGGDAALENALILSDAASATYLIHRSRVFRARREFTEALVDAPNIEQFLEYKVNQIIGRDKLEALEIQNVDTGEIKKLAVDCLLIRIGVEPNTEAFRGAVEMDAPGYILVDANQETSLPGVFAIGDAASPGSLSLSTAIGSASTAAKSAYLYING